ncbi:uncharacterized protein LOC112054553 [Bicyclus anynana]|uniref:Uncharacterized protein LOC112054553 n=1 Tax=Bicyclus anynana TaxID=110368 RepID=A0A6J1NXY9_BICAN|nr:uncharacterized protein LOC112054553 [Bicyclus anynana]
MLLNIKTVILLTYGMLCVREALCYPPPVPVDILTRNIEHLSQQLEHSRIPIENRRLFFRLLIKNIQGKTRDLFSKFTEAPASSRTIGPSWLTGPTGSIGPTESIWSTVATGTPMNNTQDAAKRTETLSKTDQPYSDVARNINSQSNSGSTVDSNAVERQITEEPNPVDLDSYPTTTDINNEEDELSIRIVPQQVVATLLG